MPRVSYISSYHHCVFSTKDRRPMITPVLQERLWPFLGGIARQNKLTAIEIGGVEDHVHILLSLPPTVSIAKALQLLREARRSGYTKLFQTNVCSVGRQN